MQVREPVNNVVNNAPPGVFRSGRLKAISEILKPLGKAQIDAARGKHERESEGPETDHAVQVPRHTLPSCASLQRQAATPRFEARPPDHQACRRKRDQCERANTVHCPAGLSGEQVVVQIKQEGDEPDAGRDRLAKITAAPGIEQPALDIIAPDQRDLNRFIQIPRPAQIHNPVAGIQARGSVRQLFVRQSGFCAFRDDGCGSRRPIKFVTIDEYTSRHADQQNVEADRDPAPQVYLKDCPS